MAKAIIDLLTYKVDKFNNVLKFSIDIEKAFIKTIQAPRSIKMYKDDKREELWEKFKNNMQYQTGYNIATITKILAEYAIVDANTFADAIIDNYDWLQANPRISMYMGCLDITQPVANMTKKKLTKRQLAGKDLYDSSERYRGMSIKKAKRYVKNNKNEAERLVVVRNRWGNTEPAVYVMHGPWNELEVRKFRMAYAYKTCSNYYEASPILYSTCIDDPDRFYMTKPGNKDLELDDKYCA